MEGADASESGTDEAVTWGWLRRELYDRLDEVSWPDKIAYGLVVFMCLVGFLAPLVLALSDRRLPLSNAYHQEGAMLDPWGELYEEGIVKHSPVDQMKGFPSMYRAVYSKGPNGHDERGEGDDVVLLARGDLRLAFYRHATGVLLILALVVAGVWEFVRFLRRQLRRPPAGLPLELARSLVLGVPLGAVLGGLAWGGLSLAEEVAPETIGWLETSMLVPLPLALAVTSYGVIVLLLLWLRLRQPKDEVEEQQAEPTADTSQT